MPLKPWKLIQSNFPFIHKWYRLRKDIVELPNGRIVDDYFVSERPDVVLVFPITVDGDVIFVRQYKHGASAILVELPGGTFDRDTETAESAAQRELMEETGYSYSSLEKIAVLVDNPTKDTNKIHVYIARGVSKTDEQSLDENEEIEILSFHYSTLEDRILNGEIQVSGTVAAIFISLKKYALSL
ncbi:MAG TPA: NUDIX hydrolase [Cytophagaceae bacterium]|jgi:8-oxo-dGTP pyrophosphatase MutT (NUDIX family)